MVSKLWRTAVISAAACGVVAAGVGPAVAQTTQSGPVITISAGSLNPPLLGHIVVPFRDGKYSSVTISGSVTGFTSGQEARLYSQPFPYKKAPAAVAGQQQALDGTSPESYSFKATPGIATRYSVEVLPSSTISSPVAATSASRTVYVVTYQLGAGVKTCNRAGNRPVCHQTIRIYTRVPAAALKAEAKKKLYFYFGIKLARYKEPSSGPKYLDLDHSAVIGKAKRLSATEYEQTVTFSFKVYEDGYNFNFNFCTRDTEPKDGVNLPGHHGCGASKVSGNAEYLG
jgi:hypothetical protein